MARIKKKLLAQELRQKGYSISEIAKKLNMHKSGTISKWCRDISLTSEQINRLAKKQRSGSYKGRLTATEKLRRMRMKEVEQMRKEGLKEIGKLNKKDLFISGVGIYWSEGYTHSSNDQVGFTNSDPRMILFMLKWFEEICKVPKERLSLQIRINKIHKNRVKEIERYWSKITGIPLPQFTKTILIETRSKKIYPNPNTYFGTIRILVHQGTRLRRKINGWIEGLAKTACSLVVEQ
jgi:transposase-like protein